MGDMILSTLKLVLHPMEQKVLALLCLNKGLISSSKQKIITIESWYG